MLDDAIERARIRESKKSRKALGRIIGDMHRYSQHICFTCERAFQVAWEISLASYRSDGAEWQKTKKDFLKSTTSTGCHLCIIISHGFDSSAIDMFDNLDADAILRLQMSFVTIRRNPSNKLGFNERYRLPAPECMDEEPSDSWLCTTSSNMFADGKEIKMEFRLVPAYKGSEYDSLSTRPAKHHSTGSIQNLQLARAWIKTCQDCHTICNRFRPQKSNWRPTRLVNVEHYETRGAVLSISENNFGSVDYCALSYCWGLNQALVLTKNLLPRFQQGIPLEHLPATICDAIRDTRNLGYSFLWVDSLCIVQDSEADWEVESAQMSDVYGRASCTIAAAGAADVTQNMHRYRDPRKVRPCKIELGGMSWIIYPHRAQQKLRASYNDNPLSKRGWTLQERLLSPRVLMFGDNQLLWSCVTIEASETFPMGADPELSTPLDESCSLTYMRQCFMRLLYVDGLPSDVWPDILGLYTRAKLTKSEDKLVALQGVANKLGKCFIKTRDGIRSEMQLQDHYFAGLWKDQNIIRSLLWRTVVGQTRQSPRDYRAPSWSWASVDGEIVPCKESPLWGGGRDLADVLDIHTESFSTVRSSVIMGQVSHGFLDLETCLRECFVIRDEAADGLQRSLSDGRLYLAEKLDVIRRAAVREGHLSDMKCYKWNHPCTLVSPLKKALFTSSIILDSPDDIPSNKLTQVFCAPMSLVEYETDRYEQHLWESFEGLILKPCEQQNPDLDRCSDILIGLCNDHPSIGYRSSSKHSDYTGCFTCNGDIGHASDLAIQVLGKTEHKDRGITMPAAIERDGPCKEIGSTDAVNSLQNAIQVSPDNSSHCSAPRVFQRIGVFSFDIYGQEQKVQERELFGSCPDCFDVTSRDVAKGGRKKLTFTTPCDARIRHRVKIRIV